MKTKLLCFFLQFFISTPLWADYSNYKTILIGDRAAGMGGAFTALTGDSAGSSYYNPATLARMEGNSLSASVSIYNKYETNFGNQDDFSSAALRVNQGSIVPIPASGGSVYSFGNFAFGLSIVFPDFELYAGEVRSTPDTTSYINLRDQSLWVGGTVALNVTEADALGLTMYYTSRSFTRSLVDQSTQGAVTSITNEEKIYAQNSLVYLLGYYRELTPQWTVGLSARLPSIPISGHGSYFRSEIDTSGGPLATPVNERELKATTMIPAKYTLGIAYEQKGYFALSADIDYADSASYSDMDHAVAAEHVVHKPTWNFSVGAEYYLKYWLALRAGIYSNLSSHPLIPDDTGNKRWGDHVDMWGFSTNVAIYTSESSRITLGGYYSGGKGYSTQQVAQSLEKIQKSVQVFSFLVGTSFQF